MMPMMLILVMCSVSETSTLQGNLSSASMTYSFNPMPEIDVLEGSGLVEPKVAVGVRDALGLEAAKTVNNSPVGAKFQIKGVKFIATENNDYKATVVLVGKEKDLLFPIKETFSLQQLTETSAQNPLELEYNRPDSDPESSYDWKMVSNFMGSIYFENDTKQLRLVEGKIRFEFNYKGLFSRGTEHYPAQKEFYELAKSHLANLDSDSDLSNVDSGVESDLALTE